MAIRIGKVCIEDVNIEDALKKHGIYYIGKDLDDVITKKKPLDYEFLVIDGSKECLFIKAIQCLFNNKWPEDSGKLKKIVEDEIPCDQFNEIECAETVFTWMSRVIERLPGRIIIVDDKNKPKEGDPPGKSEQEHIQKVSETVGQGNQEADLIQIQKWIKRRVCWIIPSELLKNYEFKLNNESKEFQSSKFNCDEFKNSLLLNWLKNFPGGVDFDLEVKLDEPKAEITKEEAVNKKIILIKKLYNNLIGANIAFKQFDKLLSYPFDCYLNMSPHDLGRFARKFIDINPGKQSFNNFLTTKGINPETKQKIDKDYFDIFLKKFFEGEEEEITGSISDSNSNHVPRLFKSKYDSLPVIKSFFVNCEKSTQNKKIISYYRHGEIFLHRSNKGTRTGKYEKKEYYYYEGLSGASPHFQVIASHLIQSNDDKILNTLLSLVENGLIKIVIADERIAKYVDSEDKRNEFENNGLFVLKGINGLIDEYEISDYNNEKWLNSFNELKNEAEKGAFDFFIIHQGVIDKIKINGKTIDHNTINKWKKRYFPFVFVTSGRGTPENVPVNVKFLPFSNLENALVRKPISKFILTRTLFKSVSSQKNKE